MILVDSRDGSRELLAPLLKAGLPAELDHLEFADIAFVGRGLGSKPVMIGVEFKRLGEMVQAMVTERLQGHQIPGMLRTYDPDLTGQRVYLLVEGEWRADTTGRLLQRTRRGEWKPIVGAPPASAVRKRLLTLATRAGVTVWPTLTRAETIAWLVDLYHVWTDKDLDAHRSHLAIYKPDLDSRILHEPTPFERVVSGLPGVGDKVLEAAQARFGSIYRAITASAQQWAGITTLDKRQHPRVLGDKYAAQIVQAIHKGE